MSDKIQKSEELRNKIDESVQKIQEIGFLKKLANKVGLGKDDSGQEEEKEETQSSGSKFVHMGGNSWKLNGNPIENLIINNGRHNSEEILMNYDWEGGALSWLAKAKFKAKFLVINLDDQYVDVFVGEWFKGDFRGNIFTDEGIGRIQASEGDSKFHGGRFLGKMLKINYTYWFAKPIYFLGRTIMKTEKGILGLPNMTDTKDIDHNGFYLMQVPRGYSIKFKLEDDETIHVIRVIKRMDDNNTDFVLEYMETGNKVTMPWKEMQKNFNNFVFKRGRSVSIPGIFSSKTPIWDIEIKKSSAVTKTSIGKEYQSKKGGGLTKISFGKEFPVLGKMGLTGDFRLLNFNKILSQDPDSMYFIKSFQNDIKNSGEIFTSHVNNIKAAIENRDKYKREVGYGQYPYLKKLTDKQGGKITDEKLDKSLKYMNDFVKYVVGNIGKFDKSKNFQPDTKAQAILLQAMKKAIGFIKEKAPKQDDSKKNTRNTASSISKLLEVRKMVRDIMQNEDDETFFGK